MTDTERLDHMAEYARDFIAHTDTTGRTTWGYHCGYGPEEQSAFGGASYSVRPRLFTDPSFSLRHAIDAHAAFLAAQPTP